MTTKESRPEGGQHFDIRNYSSIFRPIIPQAMIARADARLHKRLSVNSWDIVNPHEIDLMVYTESGGFLFNSTNLWDDGFSIFGWSDGTCAAIWTPNGSDELSNGVFKSAYEESREFLEIVAAFARGRINSRGVA